MTDPKDIIPLVVDMGKAAGRPPVMPQPGAIEIIGETIILISNVMKFLGR